MILSDRFNSENLINLKNILWSRNAGINPMVILLLINNFKIIIKINIFNY